MVDYIMNSGFEKERIQLVACTYDNEADSGQKILDMIKVPLFERGWRNIKTVNVVGKAIKTISEGKNQIIIIDEFLGTGRSLRTRVEWLNKNANQPIEIKCCFMAGMKYAVETLKADSIDIFRPLTTKKQEILNLEYYHFLKSIKLLLYHTQMNNLQVFSLELF